ncbi:hypothetical protein CFN78_01520 [Amycolatopsis antarctica]|uniref:WXG100 family type VII secretion target n=1 Tax=Amycolatopsis antarctica TaxID=1854586 RepID=A0A263D958_9PSEU|nr:hypothetical protein [Amycolatopsis antarctica]OZM74921.1 hypothetical protein CFN78_01520 [Amycolatopsis antarctica]
MAELGPMLAMVPPDKRDRVNEIFDSPYATPEQKREVMKAALPPMFGGGDFDAKYESARSTIQRSSASDRRVQDAAGQSKQQLDAMRPPAPGGAGVTASDEVLDLAKPTLDFLCSWINQVWNPMPDSPGQIDYMARIWDSFYRNAGIDFRNFLADADEFGKAHGIVETTLGDCRNHMNTLFGEWTGPAATAASVKFNEAILPDGQALLDHLKGASELVPETVTAVYDTVRAQVDEVLPLFTPTIANATLAQATRVVAVAKGESTETEDIATVFAVFGSEVSPTEASSLAILPNLHFDIAIDFAKNWVSAFTNEFAGILDAFDTLCEQAVKAVDEKWFALGEYMSGYANKFTESAGAPSAPGPAPMPASGGTASPPGGSAPSPGTGGPPPAPSTAAGAPSMPAPPAPPEPPAAEPAATTESAAVPAPPVPETAAGTNPVAGAELERDPETGEAFAIDPETGESVPDAAAEQDVTTVRRGDNELSLTAPGPDGRGALSVQGADGEAREYMLDFGSADAPVPDGEAPDGEQAQAGSQDVAEPDEAGQDGQDDGTGAANRTVVTPGEDGAIRITDGDLEIVAERPDGPDGPTVVTVDDGSGEPTTYTLGEQDTEAPDAEALAPGDAGGLADSPEVAAAPVTGETVGEPATDASSGIETDDAETGVPLAGEAGQPESVTPAAETAALAGAESAETPVAATGAPEPPAEAVTSPPDSAATSPAESVPSANGAVPADVVDAPSSGSLPLDDAGADFADEPGQRTTPSAAIGSGVDGVAGEDVDARESAAAGSTTPADTGGAQLGSAPGGAEAATAGAGVGGMMGGMGAAGGGNSGDQERGSSPWRTGGDLFDTSGVGGRISGSLDDGPDRPGAWLDR